MAKTNATQRSLKELRENGWSCHIVEKYIKFPNMPFGKRIDAFGIGDILACRPPKIIACAKCEATGGVDINRTTTVVCPDCGGTGRRCADEPAIALVQCFPNTGGTGFADHRAKILAIPEAEIWIRAGGKIFLQGWKRHKQRPFWRMKQEEVVLARDPS